jgi:DNA processing protein
MTHNLSLALSKAGICIVSGGAMGVDAIAHNGAKSSNTIAVFVISNNKLNSTIIKLNG